MNQLFLFCICIVFHYHVFGMNNVPQHSCTSAQIIKNTCYQLLNGIIDIHWQTLKQYTLLQRIIDSSPSLDKNERTEITYKIQLWVNELADRKNMQISPIHTILSDIKNAQQIVLQKSDVLMALSKSVHKYMKNERDRLCKLKSLTDNMILNRITPLPSSI